MLYAVTVGSTNTQNRLTYQSDVQARQHPVQRLGAFRSLLVAAKTWVLKLIIKYIFSECTVMLDQRPVFEAKCQILQDVAHLTYIRQLADGVWSAISTVLSGAS
jgi:hypothetical protein